MWSAYQYPIKLWNNNFVFTLAFCRCFNDTLTLFKGCLETCEDRLISQRCGCFRPDSIENYSPSQINNLRPCNCTMNGLEKSRLVFLLKIWIRAWEITGSVEEINREMNLTQTDLFGWKWWVGARNIYCQNSVCSSLLPNGIWFDSLGVVCIFRWLRLYVGCHRVYYTC